MSGLLLSTHLVSRARQNPPCPEIEHLHRQFTMMAMTWDTLDLRFVSSQVGKEASDMARLLLTDGPVYYEADATV